ncbi:MAG: hypothetical protein CME65_01835 [Halobacteriovoraceae bacterium]|nr:hypothetical protein [Halobacteriovoraceae bacterium]|tara:strand:+ start:8967 stop:10091 length:1125 start_codon:yes stop_codon:yes gene_type:complete
MKLLTLIFFFLFDLNRIYAQDIGKIKVQLNLLVDSQENYTLDWEASLKFLEVENQMKVFIDFSAPEHYKISRALPSLEGSNRKRLPISSNLNEFDVEIVNEEQGDKAKAKLFVSITPLETEIRMSKNCKLKYDYKKQFVSNSPELLYIKYCNQKQLYVENLLESKKGRLISLDTKDMPHKEKPKIAKTDKRHQNDDDIQKIKIGLEYNLFSFKERSQQSGLGVRVEKVTETVLNRISVFFMANLFSLERNLLQDHKTLTAGTNISLLKYKFSLSKLNAYPVFGLRYHFIDVNETSALSYVELPIGLGVLISSDLELTLRTSRFSNKKDYSLGELNLKYQSQLTTYFLSLSRTQVQFNDENVDFQKTLVGIQREF